MNEIGRRDFLYAAGAAAAATKMTALGADKTIRTAIWGVQHGHTTGKLRALQDSPDYEIVAVHEPDEAVRKERQGDARFEGLRWVTGGREFKVDEVACRAMGDESCAFAVYKEPVA